MLGEEERLKAKFVNYVRYGSKLNRAIETVLGGGVKVGMFLPSGRKIITVVGRLGDEFVDPEGPYCSCSNFYFQVQSGREETCYHLLSYEIAIKTGRSEIIEFDDEEYGPYFVAVVRDVFEVLRKSSG